MKPCYCEADSYVYLNLEIRQKCADSDGNGSSIQFLLELSLAPLYVCWMALRIRVYNSISPKLNGNTWLELNECKIKILHTNQIDWVMQIYSTEDADLLCYTFDFNEKLRIIQQTEMNMKWYFPFNLHQTQI